MSYEMIAILMFSTMMLMLLTGQRVFGAIGFALSGAAKGGIVLARNISNWPVGPMDKAPAYGAGDCGFKSRREH